MAARISPTVEKLRGLTFRTEVPVRVVNDEAARKHFRSRTARFWPEDRIRAEQIALSQIGLLPPGTDLMESLLSVLEEQVGGFYDPESDTFFVLDDMPRSIAPIILAHELTHALDDQHYGIDELLSSTIDNEDRGAAVAAVVEGSGTLVMSSFLLGEIQAGRMSPADLLGFQESEAMRAEKLMSAAPYLQRGLVSSYVLGQTFLLRGNPMQIMAGPKAGDVDRAFQDPPASSEQILHPEKYWDEANRDRPRDVDVPDLSGDLGEGWSLGASGHLGEINLAILAGSGPMNPAAPDVLFAEKWTNPAVQGWAGDRWHLYERGESRATVLVTLWDTPADAEEFENGILAVRGRRSFRRGDIVVLVAGETGDRTAVVATRVLRALLGDES